MDEDVYFALVCYGVAGAFTGAYGLQCWLLYRLARKFAPCDWLPHCVPGYALVLLCRQLQLSPWVALGLVLPPTYPCFAPYLYYRLAGRLHKQPPWLWSAGLTVLPPLLILPALDESRPAPAAAAGRQAALRRRPPAGGRLYPPVLVQPAGPAGTAAPIPLPLDGLAFGRDPAAVQVLVAQPLVSRLHARLLPNLGAGPPVLLEDLASRNGTYYQKPGNPLWHQALPHVKVLLPLGSKVRIGEATFQLLPPPEAGSH